jgi:inorganic triphosphatase YgiF
MDHGGPFTRFRSMAQELEIRLAARPDDLKRLTRGSALAGLMISRPATRRLSTVYYDTPNLGFAKEGLSLRVRKKGRSYIQTVKTGSSGALASDRGEYECKLSSATPDLDVVPEPDVRERMRAIAEDEGFEPKIETEIRRTTRALKTESGDEIELALDRGEIRTLTNGHAVLPVSEVELELKQGSPAALYSVARALSRETPLTVRIESKAERGLRALEGREVTAHKAGRAELKTDCTAEEAFRATLLHCLRHIAGNTAAVAEARDVEGVHQIRVGLRRLRAALSAYGDAFRSRALDELRQRAKTLADMFGETRELDVFATELLTPVEEAAKKPGLPQLRVLLEEVRGESWDRTVALVQSDKFTGFVLDLAAAIEGRVWRDFVSFGHAGEFLRPAAEMAAEALDRKLRKTCKRAKHLSRLSVEERHHLRIALKKLRYSAEFFAPLFSAKAVSAFLSRLSKLQDLFGVLNDASTVEKTLRRIAEHSGEQAQAELHQAAAFVEGWHQSRVPMTWKKAKKRWKRFAKTEPFWRA